MDCVSPKSSQLARSRFAPSGVRASRTGEAPPCSGAAFVGAGFAAASGTCSGSVPRGVRSNSPEVDGAAVKQGRCPKRFHRVRRMSELQAVQQRVFEKGRLGVGGRYLPLLLFAILLCSVYIYIGTSSTVVGGSSLVWHTLHIVCHKTIPFHRGFFLKESDWVADGTRVCTGVSKSMDVYGVLSLEPYCKFSG